MVAYNAEKTIDAVIARIPGSLAQKYDAEVLILDDASADATFSHSHSVGRRQETPFPIRVLFNARREGYGAIQKLGYQYGIENGFDLVALLHGDGQYPPERLLDLLEPLRTGDAAAVLGSRMTTRWGALRDGMPLYKFVGNRILTGLENRLLHTRFSDAPLRIPGVLAGRPAGGSLRTEQQRFRVRHRARDSTSDRGPRGFARRPCQPIPATRSGAPAGCFTPAKCWRPRSRRGCRN